MNIEIANKLVKLRKQAGLSQEELADKLGLSRQAVSKWERAEASPDTDNLICLAKLYGVSLDELLSTEDDTETIIEEQVKKDDEIIDPDDDDDEDDDEDEENDSRTPEEKKKDRILYWSISGILYSIAAIAYILLGILLNMWGTMWILFFVPDIIMSSVKAIRRKLAHHFNITFLALFTFFLICWALFPQYNLWHPMWVVFLAIPIYYIIVNRIETIKNLRK